MEGCLGFWRLRGRPVPQRARDRCARMWPSGDPGGAWAASTSRLIAANTRMTRPAKLSSPRPGAS